MRIAAAAILSMIVIAMIASQGHATTVTPAQAASATQRLGALNPVFFGSSLDAAVVRGRALTEGGASAGSGPSLSQLLSGYAVFGEGRISATSFFDHARLQTTGHF